MNRLWKSWRQRSQPDAYQVQRLVDARRLQHFGRGGRQIVCDIDKTYLETEFESIIRMARIAFEAAAAKVTVTGASDVLLRLRWGDPGGDPPGPDEEPMPRPLHFVSSSPPQLRAVLEEKLTMDGLDWSSDTFKNQAYNLRMGRMDLLRQHVAYKSRAILSLIQDAGEGASFTLIGDNAESDAYIYVGVKLLLSGQLSAESYQTWLTTAGVDAAVAADVTSDLRLPPHCRIEGILIRNVPGYAFIEQEPLSLAVQTFDNFYQAALLLMTQGLFPADQLWALTRKFHNHHGMTLRQLAGMLEVVRASRALTPEARSAIEAALAKLASPPDAEAATTLEASLGRDLSAFTALTEAEVLRQARLWIQRVSLEKAKH